MGIGNYLLKAPRGDSGPYQAKVDKMALGHPVEDYQDFPINNPFSFMSLRSPWFNAFPSSSLL